MLKKTVLVVALLLIATNLWAEKKWDVTKTTHNLGFTGTDPSGDFDNEVEVCIFCHTPHGGSTNGPLWNRTMSGAAFTHYSSATLAAVWGAAVPVISNARAVNPESLLCMSCHDGTVGMNSLLNYSNTTDNGGVPTRAGVPEMFDTSFGLGGANPLIGEPIAVGGTSLTDDHPISFSYSAAQAVIPSKLHAADDSGTDPRLVGGVAGSVRLFGAALNVECSSCHDPHVDYSVGTGDINYTPFLVMPNTASNLCLACHIK